MPDTLTKTADIPEILRLRAHQIVAFSFSWHLSVLVGLRLNVVTLGRRR
jgi:hypothetical protein